MERLPRSWQDLGKIMARSWQDNHGKTCKLLLIVHNLFFSQIFLVICDICKGCFNNFEYNNYWSKIVIMTENTHNSLNKLHLLRPSFGTWDYGIAIIVKVDHTKQTFQVATTCDFAISVWKPTFLAVICLQNSNHANALPIEVRVSTSAFRKCNRKLNIWIKNSLLLSWLTSVRLRFNRKHAYCFGLTECFSD